MNIRTHMTAKFIFMKRTRNKITIRREIMRCLKNGIDIYIKDIGKGYYLFDYKPFDGSIKVDFTFNLLKMRYPKKKKKK